MNADLVRAARFQAALNKRVGLADVFQRLHVGDRFLALVAFRRAAASVTTVADELAAKRAGCDAAGD